METSTVGTTLLNLEKTFWEAMKTRDGKTAEKLSDDDVIVVGPQGIGTLPRSAVGPMIAKPPYDLTQFKLDDQKAEVRMVSDDVAIVAYKVNEEMVVDGKKTALDAYDSSVWVRKDGQWVCALHTESLAGDPYGRDRIAAS